MSAKFLVLIFPGRFLVFIGAVEVAFAPLTAHESRFSLWERSIGSSFPACAIHLDDGVVLALLLAGTLSNLPLTPTPTTDCRWL